MANNVIRNFVAKNVNRRKKAKAENAMRVVFDNAASVIGRAWRCYDARMIRDTLIEERDMMRVYAACLIQSIVRRNMAIEEAAMRECSIVVLQSVMRGTLVRIDLMYKNMAAVMIQSCIRKNMAKAEFIFRTLCATRIQKVARGMLGRRIRDRRIQEIDDVVRRMMEQQESEYYAALCIQTYTRRFLVLNDLWYQQYSAVEVQKIWRGHSSLMEYQMIRTAATMIQASERMRIQFAKYKLNIDAACTIQRFWREASRVKEEIKTVAVTVIQSCVRGMVRRRSVGGDFAKFRDGCIVIQKAYRAFVSRSTYRGLRKATILIQAWVRSKLATAALCKSIAAAVAIQSAVRGHLSAAKFEQQRCCATEIQRRFRAFTFARSAKTKFESTRSSIVLVQSIVRSKLASAVLRKNIAAATGGGDGLPKFGNCSRPITNLPLP